MYMYTFKDINVLLILNQLPFLKAGKLRQDIQKLNVKVQPVTNVM